jgi:hypothetical protein
MVTLKRRFRGVRQNLKRARAYLDRKLYDRFWRHLKKEKRL